MAFKFNRYRFSPQERLNFTQQLASLLGAGIPLEKALAILGKLKFSPQMGDVINQLRRMLQEGLSFTMALERFPSHFPPLFISMVRAGEAGGILPQVLQKLAQYLEEELNLRRFIISSLFYPVILMIASIVAIIFYVVNVIPQFKSIFADMGAQLPLITRLVMICGQGLLTFWPLALITVLFAIGWFVKESATAEGRIRLDRLKLRLPLAGPVLRKIAISRLTLALSLLYESGVSFLSSLSIAGEIMGNRFLAKALAEVESEVRQGNTLAGSLAAKHVFPVLAVEMIGVGEESGNLGPMLQQVSRTYDGEVKHSLSVFVSVFEPLMILVMVGVIAILAVAVLLPVTNISNQIQ
ncbi:MAG: type II secretion system F family protein [Bacillota bacterium]